MTDTETEASPSPEELVAKVTELQGALAQAGKDFVDFKAKVRKEAMAMAEEHGYCDVVERTLTKIGIGTARKRVTIVTPFERVVTYEVPEDLLNSYSSDEEMITAVTRFHGGRLHGAQNRAWQQSRLINQNERGAGVARVETGTPQSVLEGYDWFYTSDDGRVMHAVPTQGAERPRGTVNALCGATGSFHRWRNTSARGTDGHCARCEERARGLS